MAPAIVSSTILLVAVLLVAEPATNSPLAQRTVFENRSVVVDRQVEIELGTPVSELGADFAYDAYDADSGDGIVQWLRPDSGPVMLLVRDRLVRAISVAFAPDFRTSRGVGLGDPEGSLDAAYGGSLEEVGPGYLLAGGRAYTYFDTSCTGQVNAIGLALGAEGLLGLGTFWSPADPADPCAML